MRIVSSIVRKRYISEMDLLRLQKALLLARMNANSTYLVDKNAPGYSSKLERLEELFDELLAETERKIVLFSEWTTMLGLIEARLLRFGADYVRLDGSVPQKKRQQLVHRFQRDTACRLFLATNAGATGLNLQVADTIINVDLPWNPAVLEQRIGRAHRMGQKRPVQVYLLVTEQTIEEKLLATLSAKHDLALAALDMESDVREVALASGIEELKRRLEVLLGAKPDAAVDESERQRQREATERLAHRARVAEAGGQLVAAAFNFLGQVLPHKGSGGGAADTAPIAREIKARLDDCLERDEQGRPRLSVTLPDDASLDELARSLAVLLDQRAPRLDA
jgi:superfamily II DNA/RNA helicase